MEPSIREIGQRIQTLREILEISREEMAAVTGVSVEKYTAMEEGQKDIGISFAYKCAVRFGVDVSDLLEGKSPTLTGLSVVRSGKGIKIARRTGFDYVSLAPLFKNKKAEPFLVRTEYSEAEQHEPIHTMSHAGQEIDIILHGSMKLVVGENVEILEPGDVAFFDSSIPHGMIAVGGEDCEFYAIVIGGDEVEDKAKSATKAVAETKKGVLGIADKYITTTVDDEGIFSGISFHDDDNFNFGFDVVDAIGKADPEKLAMLHLDKHMNERRFTFKEISRESNRAANYFRSLGIRKGDKVMMILKRHYQFWIAMIGLNKLGAVAIPATNQLLKKDIVYRCNAAGVKAIIATPDDNVPTQIEESLPESPTVEIKMIVGGPRQGWRDFDADLACFSSHFDRTDVGGDDPLLMYFTSGTTGYPKIATHVHKYPLGHYATARFWHNVDPNGLHLTISDTGWAKAMWGKLYGQWLAEGPLFVYDFDRFHAEDILPLFAKYGITTFCAPPTMYRFLIKEDLGKYDLSSIKHASIAGEALNPEVMEQFKKHTGLTIMEAFGPTEITDVCAWYRVDREFGDADSLPIGFPCANTRIALIDGEICVSGTCLSPGYYNAPDKTAAAFVQNSLRPEIPEIMYKTGDLGEYNDRGELMFLGRRDSQIKRSGYRIELGEIEAALCAAEGVVLGCCYYDADREKIVAAFTGEAEIRILKTALKEKLPKYMLPDVILHRDDLPRTGSGKIDRKALRQEAEYEHLIP